MSHNEWENQTSYTFLLSEVKACRKKQNRCWNYTADHELAVKSRNCSHGRQKKATLSGTLWHFCLLSRCKRCNSFSFTKKVKLSVWPRIILTMYLHYHKVMRYHMYTSSQRLWEHQVICIEQTFLYSLKSKKKSFDCLHDTVGPLFPLIITWLVLEFALTEFHHIQGFLSCLSRKPLFATPISSL